MTTLVRKYSDPRYHEFLYMSNMANLSFYMFFSCEVETCGCLCRYEFLASTIYKALLKGHGNEADFLGFLQKLVPHESLTLPFEPFTFLLRIAEIFVFEKGLPASLIHGVADSPHHWYGESAIEFFKRKLSVSMIRRVVDSPHQW